MTREYRIHIVNEIIKEIANRGRNFFKYNDNVAYLFYKNNKLYMRNEYNNVDMYLSTKYGYPPKKWTHGGTLWGLTKDFKEYILKGKKSNGVNGYGGLYCNHWGYSEEDMIIIQNKAKELGFL